VFADLIRDVVDYHDDLLRNIATIRASQDLFDDLSGDSSDQAVAIAAELADRLPSAHPLLSRPFDYGAVITFPFIEFNGHQTRFSDGLRYGVWYGSMDVETTVYETAFHWHRFVMDAFPAEDRVVTGERRVFSARCDAILIDLRGKRERRLTDRRDYAFTNALGRYLRDQATNGLLVRSARCNGINAALFRPEALSGVRDNCRLTYKMNPTRDSIRVERTRGRKWMEIRASTLE
jgi:RES domain-containing protein